MCFALYGRVAFLCLSKEKSPKERIPDMPALRVPCDARISRRDVKLANAQTVTSRTLRLILCFSASLNGRFKTKITDRGLKTKENNSSFLQTSSQNPFFKDSGYRPAPV